MDTYRILLLLASSGLYGASIQEKLAKDILQTDPATSDVIVQYRQAPSEAQHARIRSRGGALKQDLSPSGAAAYRISAGSLRELSRDAEVISISADNPVFSTAPPAAFSGAPDYGWMTALSLNSWSDTVPYAGNGVGVAIIDSGIGKKAYPEFGDNANLLSLVSPR